MTRAPSSRASCTACNPTPPLAPVTSTVSSGHTWPRVRTTCTAVPVVQHAVAAASQDSPGGTRPSPATGAAR